MWDQGWRGTEPNGSNTKETGHMDPRNPCDSTQGFSQNRTRGNWLHKTRQEEAQWTQTSNVVGEKLKMKRNAGNNKARQDEDQCTRTPTLVGEELKTKRNARNNKARQEEAQRTQTSNVVREELKTKGRRCLEERKIKRLNHCNKFIPV